MTSPALAVPVECRQFGHSLVLHTTREAPLKVLGKFTGNATTEQLNISRQSHNAEMMSATAGKQAAKIQ
jgi:hypothetical protein